MLSHFPERDQLTGLAAVFEPRRVALVGASDQPGKTGELLWRNLSSFAGEVVPVTPSAPTVAGRTAYRTLLAVPGDIDLAVVVVPAHQVPAVIQDAAVRGVPAVVIISGGFAESGPEGRGLQDELITAARAGGVRVVGPNCFGVQNCDLPLNASLAAGLPRGGGGISLVTQSGAYGMAVHSLGIDERIRFAKVYAAGNKTDITDTELLGYLGADPASRTLCFFLESLPDGRAFYEAACAMTPDKPVVVAKTGRSTAGARAAQSHTAGLAGSERVWRGAFEQAGVILTRSGLEMLDVARALDAQPVPRGRRVAIITNSGGTGVELADLLADEGLEVPELSATQQVELAALLPRFASPRNPIDITPVWSRFAELYPMLVERLARSGEVDAVVVILLQRSAADERIAVDVRDAVGRLSGDRVPVPVYVCWVAPRTSRTNADLLQDGGVPCFEWPERTARALGHAVRYGEARARVRPALAAPERPAGLPPLTTGWLDADVAAGILAAAGIPAVASRVCATVDEARLAADEMGYPVVAKVVHPAFLHKGDAGGVRLGLFNAGAVRDATADLLALVPDAVAPDALAADALAAETVGLARRSRVLVQRQATGIEVIVGGIRDPQFGPVVMVGLGGAFVEAIDDVAVALAPLRHDDSRRLLLGLRGHGILTGSRRGQPVDLDALSALICALGDLLAAVPEIAELDLNPVLATASGCVAVDWRIRVQNLTPQDEDEAKDSPRHAGESDFGSP